MSGCPFSLAVALAYPMQDEEHSYCIVALEVRHLNPVLFITIDLGDGQTHVLKDSCAALQHALSAAYKDPSSKQQVRCLEGGGRKGGTGCHRLELLHLMVGSKDEDEDDGMT